LLGQCLAAARWRRGWVWSLHLQAKRHAPGGDRESGQALPRRGRRQRRGKGGFWVERITVSSHRCPTLTQSQEKCNRFSIRKRDGKKELERSTGSENR